MRTRILIVALQPTASFEKLILDAELLQMMDAYVDPIDTSTAALGLNAIREAGPGGITLARPRRWSVTKPPSIRRCCPTGKTTRTGGTMAASTPEPVPIRSGKSCCANTSRRCLPPPIIEALEDFVARRKSEGGAPLN